MADKHPLVCCWHLEGLTGAKHLGGETFTGLERARCCHCGVLRERRYRLINSGRHGPHKVEWVKEFEDGGPATEAYGLR